MAEVDICYIVSHGFAARMVTQTNLLGLLANTGKRVAIIAPDKGDQNLKEYCKEKGVLLYEFRSESSFWTKEYNTARKYFLEDIKKNPALWEKHIYATKYNKACHPWSHIRPRILILGYYLSQLFPDVRNWFKRRETKCLQSYQAKRILDKINPKVLVSTYPVNFSEAMLLKAAKDRTATKSVIHLLSWDNITCKGHFPQLADEYIAWGEIMQEELMQYYNIPKEKIGICGIPHFDVHLETSQNPAPGPYLTGLGMDPVRPYLFIGMSSPRFAPREIDIVEWMVEAIRKDTFGKDMQLVVRPHPQNVQGGMADESWLPRLRAIHGNRVGVDFPDLVKSNMPWSMQNKDMIRLSHLLAGSTVCLNSGSTISIDTLICKRPVILTSFDAEAQLHYWQSARRLIDYTHLKKLVDLGGVSVAKSFAECKKLLQRYISDDNYNLDKRENTIRRQCHNYINGSATMACVNHFNETVYATT